MIEDALYHCDLDDTHAIQCLVTAFRRFGDPLPDGVRARLQGVQPAWLRDSLLNE